MKKEYCVYKHTSPSGKVYIGQTSKNPKYRWQNGNGYKGQIFYNAIQKYGWDNIKHEVLFDGLTKEDADKKEIELISYYDSTNPEKGYNVSFGGGVTEGLVHSEETKQKIRNAHKGMNRSKECIKKWRESRKGYSHSEETKRKISNAHSGKSIPIEKRNNMKQVICIETGIVYPSISEASRKCNIDKSSIGMVCNNVKNRPTAGGYHWCFLDEYNKDTYVIKNPKTSNASKTIICIETNIVYNSISDAEKETGIRRSSIGEVCRGKRKTAGGYHWQFFDCEQK